RRTSAVAITPPRRRACAGAAGRAPGTRAPGGGAGIAAPRGAGTEVGARLVTTGARYITPPAARDTCHRAAAGPGGARGGRPPEAHDHRGTLAAEPERGSGAGHAVGGAGRRMPLAAVRLDPRAMLIAGR